MKPTFLLRRFLAIAGSAALTSSYAHAISGNWNVNAAGNWSTAANWSSNPTVPGTAAGDIIGLNNNINAARIITIDTTSRTVGALTIGDSDNSHAFTLAASGGGTLIFNNSGAGATLTENGSVADVISAPIVLNDNLSAVINGALTLGGNITTSSGRTLTKTGAGTLTLSGTGTHSANISSASGLTLSTAGTSTFNGNLTLSGGTLGISSAGTTIAGSGLLTLSGGVTLSVPNSGAGTIIGMNQQWDGNLATTLVSASGQTITSSGTVTLNANVTVSNKATMVFDNAIGEIGGARNLTVTGNPGGNTFIVNGTNTYSGSTTISQGTFRVGGSGSLGSGTYAGAISNVGAFEYSSSTNQILSGAITGTGGTLTKNTSTASTLTLSGAGANTYTGLTTVSTGTLELNKSGAVNAIAAGGLTIGGANNTAATVRYSATAGTDQIGASAVTINGRGILDFNGKSDTIGNVAIVSTGATGSNPTPIINTAGGGNLTIGTLGITPVAGFTTVVNAGTGTITLGGDVTFNAATTGQAQISGTALALGGANRNFNVGLGTGATQDLLVDAQITGARSLTKTGNGRLTLSNTNAYTLGTTVTSGTLMLSGAFNMPSSGTLAVSNGGTFSLADGTARATTGATTGVGLTLATGSWLAFDWNGASLDSFTTTGTATSTGTVVLNINNTSPSGSGGTLITSSGVSTLNAATYLLANNIDYTATISKTTTTVSIGAQTPATALTNAYWKGGQVVGALGTMTVSTGSLSNWASDAAGTSVGVIPGGSAVNVIFGATGAAQQANVITGLTGMNLGSITFNDSAAVTIAGSPNIITLNSTSGTAATTSGALATVTAGSAISVTSFANATNTISANLALGANQTWNVASGKTLVVSGAVSGSGSLTKADAGTVTLSGTNIYTGGTTISAGTLKVGSTTALGASSSAVSVTSGAVLDVNGITIANNNALTLNGSGIGGTGALINTSNTGASYNGTITLNSASTIGNTGTGKLTLGFNGSSNNINTNGFLLTFKGVGAASPGTQNINITGSGYGIIGSGGVTVDNVYLDLRGGGIQSTNTYSGATTIQNNGGILQNGGNISTNSNVVINGGVIDGYFGSAFTRNLGTGANQVQIIGGASGFGGNNSVNVTLSAATWGSALFNPSSLILGTPNSSGNGVTTLTTGIDLNGANRTIAVNSAIGVNAGGVSGILSNSSGTAAGLTKTGVGELRLSAANTFNGTTTISAGTLNLTNSLALQNSALDTTNSVAGSASAGLKTDRTTLTLGGLTGNKDFAATGGVFTTTSGGYGSVTALTLNPAAADNHSYSGAIANGAAGMTLAKSGAGSQTLSGINTYSGNTTISAGRLEIGGTGTLGSGSYAGNISIASTSSGNFKYNSSTNQTLSGVISGAGALVKDNTSRLTLTNDNSYTGTTSVDGGILEISGSGDINSTSGITIASGATFNYNSSTALTQAITNNGTISGTGPINVAVAMDSTADVIAPGNSPGIQPYGASQTWSGLTYQWEINDWANNVAGTDFDQIAITGGLNLSGTSYALDILSLTSANNPGDVGLGSPGTFTNTNNSWTILTTTGGISNFDALEWAINDIGFTDAEPGAWSLSVVNGGNDLLLSYAAIPEPGAALLGSLGLLTILRRRRR